MKGVECKQSLTIFFLIKIDLQNMVRSIMYASDKPTLTGWSSSVIVLMEMGMLL